MMRIFLFIFLVFGLVLAGKNAWARSYSQSPQLMALVESGVLPSVGERLPRLPREALLGDGQSLGRYGGRIDMQMVKASETRQMVVYGYARLVKYGRDYGLEADILESIDVEGGRIFTMTLREGHRWSDGVPFTTEDFRFWWEDIANNKELYPSGPPALLRLNGELPKVEILSPYQVRYSWSRPNSNFLAQLAKARPLYIYAPKHYLRQFHVDYQSADKLEQLVAQYQKKNWGQLFNSLRKAYVNSNPNLPSLQAWILQTAAPATVFSFTRNPYYYKVDSSGQQLPYIDEWRFHITQKKLIPLKAATGESNLQARHLNFSDVSLLVQNQDKYGYDTRFWKQGRGSHLALYPNLTVVDSDWRELLRDKRFRRALSLAINRREINRVIYFSTADEGQNTVLEESPLFDSSYRDAWSRFDIGEANRLLDAIGLVRRDSRGIRKFAGGDSLDIIVETADSGSEQADVLSLIADSWAEIGVKLHIKPTSLEVARRRIFSGFTKFYIAYGVDNGLVSAVSSPEEFVPVRQVQYQWSRWGQYYQTGGAAGEAPDMSEAISLMRLYSEWNDSIDVSEKADIWREILEYHRDLVFTIGLVSGTIQPVVVADGVRNVPRSAIWAWEPGGHFGIYGADLFWIDE